MLQILAMLAPPLIAVGFYNHLNRDTMSTRKLVFAYGTFTVFINLIMYLIHVYLFDMNELVFSERFFISYSILAVIFAYVLPFVVNLLEASVAITVSKHGKK